MDVVVVVVVVRLEAQRRWSSLWSDRTGVCWLRASLQDGTLALPLEPSGRRSRRPLTSRHQ